jgi:hypothetical protein
VRRLQGPDPCRRKRFEEPGDRVSLVGADIDDDGLFYGKPCHQIVGRILVEETSLPNLDHLRHRAAQPDDFHGDRALLDAAHDQRRDGRGVRRFEDDLLRTVDERRPVHERLQIAGNQPDLGTASQQANIELDFQAAAERPANRPLVRPAREVGPRFGGSGDAKRTFSRCPGVAMKCEAAQFETVDVRALGDDGAFRSAPQSG